MNPNAKEFVPAHILKRRQEESERVNQITQQIGQVGIDDQENKTIAASATSSSENNTTPTPAAATTTTVTAKDTTTPATTETPEAETQSTPKENVVTSNGVDEHKSDLEEAETNASNTNNIDQHQYTNGDKQDLDNEDDSYLLKGGEAFCEFNGEQFIIPGEDDEYDISELEQYQKPDFDFGNAEDNEDEDVCNAYEEFLDNLPE